MIRFLCFVLSFVYTYDWRYVLRGENSWNQTEPFDIYLGNGNGFGNSKVFLNDPDQLFCPTLGKSWWHCTYDSPYEVVYNPDDVEMRMRLVNAQEKDQLDDEIGGSEGERDCCDWTASHILSTKQLKYGKLTFEMKTHEHIGDLDFWFQVGYFYDMDGEDYKDYEGETAIRWHLGNGHGGPDYKFMTDMVQETRDDWPVEMSPGVEAHRYYYHERHDIPEGYDRTEFHEYAFSWDPFKVQYFLDGVVLHTFWYKDYPDDIQGWYKCWSQVEVFMGPVIYLEDGGVCATEGDRGHESPYWERYHNTTYTVNIRRIKYDVYKDKCDDDDTACIDADGETELIIEGIGIQIWVSLTKILIFTFLLCYM